MISGLSTSLPRGELYSPSKVLARKISKISFPFSWNRKLVHNFALFSFFTMKRFNSLVCLSLGWKFVFARWNLVFAGACLPFTLCWNYNYTRHCSASYECTRITFTVHNVHSTLKQLSFLQFLFIKIPSLSHIDSMEKKTLNYIAKYLEHIDFFKFFSIKIIKKNICMSCSNCLVT